MYILYVCIIMLFDLFSGLEILDIKLVLNTSKFSVLNLSVYVET